MKMLVRICAVISLLVVAVYFAFKSVFLAFDLHRALPYSDQWVWIIYAWFPYLDGTYDWSLLYGFHNEHRILTSRIFLFADALFFNMNGWLPLIGQYAILAAIAALLARLVTETRFQFIIGTIAGVGLLWSISQYENLSWSFQIAFQFVRLFAIGSLMALACFLTGRSWFWLVAAGALDFLAMNSLASGILIVIPAVCIAIWMRRLDWRILAFALLHAALVCWYFNGFDPPQLTLPSISQALWFIVEFLATPFRGYPDIAISLLGITLMLTSSAVISWRSIINSKPIDPQSAILLATAVFVFGEAIMAALGGRVEAGLSPRYCSPALVFYAAMFGFLYRQLPPVRIIVVIVTALAIIGVNEHFWELLWRDKVATIDKTTAELRNGGPIDFSIIWPGVKPDEMERFVSLGFGPFAHPILSDSEPSSQVP